MCLTNICKRLKWRRSKFNKSYIIGSISKEHRRQSIDCTDFKGGNHQSETNSLREIKFYGDNSGCSFNTSTLSSIRNLNTTALNTKNKPEINPENNNNNLPSLSSIRLLDSAIKEWIARAVQNDTFSMIEMLRYYPELVTCIDPISGFTALHWAAKHGNLDIVKILCKSNLLQINRRSRGGYTALHLAQQYGHQEIVDVLVEECKADTNIRDNYGFKPHQYAKQKKYNRLILQVLF